VVKWGIRWNYPGFDLEGFVAKRQILHEQCQQAGRDPAEIMTSVHLPFAADDLDGVEASTAAFKEAGLGLVVYYLPPPHRVQDLEPLARIAERLG
ncbi:MAG: LLM class F420-dependent oxidoreductase, partial [Gammaproteobacteria bacterium]|nr:LLM class F420-dependent oxidoreductase [Gammaproteobacteria bacterium]